MPDVEQAYHTIEMAKRGFPCVGVDISINILKKAEGNIFGQGLKEKISLVCQGLEELSFKDEVFDVVYCRGVLMHIPNWERSLYNLCRVLKPGGKIVIMESNHTSLETFIVLLIRQFRKNESNLLKRKDRLEFWSQKDGNPFLVRAANIKYLISQLRMSKIKIVKRLSSEFWDINRFPSGIIRDGVIRYNQILFSLNFPPYLSVGNAIIGEKYQH